MPSAAPVYRKWLVRALLVAAALIVLWLFPPFYVLPLEEAVRERAAGVFDPEQYATEFWTERLPKQFDKAVEATKLVAAVREDRNAAKTECGTTLEAKSEYYYFLRGSGRVVSVESDAVGISLGGVGSSADILVSTGPIFNNAVRDGTGLIDPSNFPNQQDFNGISEQINRIVEEQVLPPFLERVKAGDKVEFIGCAEIVDEDADLDPMTIVPILLEVQ